MRYHVQVGTTSILHRDLDALVLAQLLRGVEAAEAAADDQDAVSLIGGHRSASLDR